MDGRIVTDTAPYLLFIFIAGLSVFLFSVINLTILRSSPLDRNMRLLIRMSHALANLLQGPPLYAAFCDSLICFTADDVFFRLKFPQIKML